MDSADNETNVDPAMAGLLAVRCFQYRSYTDPGTTDLARADFSERPISPPQSLIHGSTWITSYCFWL